MKLEEINNKITNIESLSNKKNMEIYVFFRDSNERKMGIIKNSLYPYFYVPENEEIPDYLKKHIVKIEYGFVSLFGEKLKKLSFFVVDDIFLKARDVFSITYEDDVPFTQRFIIDKNIKFLKNQRIMYIDIENDFSLDIENASKSITVICIFDNYLKKFIVWSWRSDLKEEIKESFFKDILCEYRFFSDEKKMLSDFLYFYKKNYPDIVTGWNLTRFDAPYLINRLKKLNLDYLSLSQMKKITLKIDPKNIYVKVWGHNYVDLKELTMELIKGEFPKPPGQSLGVIAEWMFGETKEIINSTPDILWRNDINSLIHYCIKDVYLLKKIDEKRGIIDFYLMQQQIIPTQFENLYYESKKTDYYMLKRFHGMFCFPSKRKRERLELMGGYIYGPFPGLYNNCVVFDFSGMYPNIYITFNISPETLVEENEDAEIKITGFEKDFQLKTVKKLHFTDKKQGILPLMLKELYTYRTDYIEKAKKALLENRNEDYKKYNQLQIATKTLLNSFYGAMAYPNFRLFNIDIANTITFIGRWILKKVIHTAEELGYKVVYGDTDSIFVIMPKDLNVEEVVLESEKLLNILNNSIIDFCKEFYPQIKVCSLHLKLEKVFSNFIVGNSKKRYAGILKFSDGKYMDEIYARGFEVIRKDVPKPCQEILKICFRKILEGENFENVVIYAKKIFFEKIKTMSLYDLGFAKTINKDINSYKVKPQHVRAAEYSNKYLGTNFSRMQTPRILFVKKVPNGTEFTDVIAVTENDTEESLENKGFKLDWETYFEKYIFNHLTKALIDSKNKVTFLSFEQKKVCDVYEIK